jgi:hypothetical protein
MQLKSTHSLTNCIVPVKIKIKIEEITVSDL